MFERLKAKTGGSKSLSHTRWSGGRGYLRRGKRTGGDRFESELCVCMCVCEGIRSSSMLRLTHIVVVLVNMLSTFNLSWE